MNTIKAFKGIGTRIFSLKIPLSRKIYFYLFLLALLISGAFWTGEYLFYLSQGERYASLRQWIWFTGILFTFLSLGGAGLMGLLLRRQDKQLQVNYEARLKQMALAHEPNLLSKNAENLILLLDPPSGPFAESDPVVSSYRVFRDRSDGPGLLSGNHSAETDFPLDQTERQRDPREDPGHASQEEVKFPGGNGKVLEAEGGEVYQSLIRDIERV